ncbi:MAG: hypothetical protein Q4G07_05980 [Oscillospiraceae bacterium]|nr:hypothetical protein [Oscillospiraceae bacterium]
MKNGFLTFIFAFIPGAGQMYLGYLRRGASLMTFFTLLIAGTTFIPFLCGPLLPVVWFFAFFDTFETRRRMTQGCPREDAFMDFGLLEHGCEGFVSRYRKPLSIGLIAVGVYLLFRQFLYWPLLHLLDMLSPVTPLHHFLSSFFGGLPTLAAAALIIWLGIRLMRGPKAPAAPDFVPFGEGEYPHE